MTKKQAKRKKHSNGKWVDIDIEEWGLVLVQFAIFVSEMLDDERDTMRQNYSTKEIAFSEDAARRVFEVHATAKDLVEGFVIGKKAYDERQSALDANAT